MKIKFDSRIEEFNSYCKDNDIDIYLVGGYVRDSLMNKECFDIDYSLVSSYDNALNVLKRKYKLKSNDIYQSIMINIDEYKIEITHARKERAYLDYRHPYEIEFINDIKEESSRRDFTINAIYYKDGILYDFYDGLKDIENKELNVIGNPKVRFKEDPLRILRMIRFSCMGFEISKQDFNIIKECAYLLKELSEDSFNKEFDKILLLNNLYVINEYKDLFEDYFELKFKDLIVLNRLSSLEEKKTYLGIKNKSIYYKYKDLVISNEKLEINKLIYKYGKDIMMELIKYHDCVYETNIFSIYNNIVNHGYYSKSDLAMNVDEIIDIIKHKELTSYYIDQISYQIMQDNIENKKEQIIEYLKKVI